MSFGGANPEQVTPEEAANFGPLSDWAAMVRLDWLGSWASQVTSTATQFVNWPQAIQDIGGQADVDWPDLLIDALTGLPLGIVTTAVGLAEAIVSALGGNPSGADTEAVLQILQVIPGSNIATFLAAAVIPGLDASKIISGQFPQSMISGLSQIVSDMLTDFSPLNAANIIGILQPWQIALVPDATTGTQTNLLAINNFPNVMSMQQGEGWSWDGTQGHLTLGSAKVIADGLINELVANEIPVLPGQNIDLSTWVKWTGLTYTGTQPIVLGITKYKWDPTSQVMQWIGTTDVAAITSPAASGGWQELAGTYTVPTEGLIPDEIRLRLKLGTATAGTVWWDEVSASKPDAGGVVPGVGNIIDEAVKGLQNFTGGLFTLPDAFSAFFNRMTASVDHGTRIQALENAALQGGTSNFALDLFERTDTNDLGTTWFLSYHPGSNGNWEIANGHDVNWDESGGSDAGVYGRFLGDASNDATSSIDKQKIQLVLATKADDAGSTSSGAQGWNGLIGRCNTAMSDMVIAWFGGDGNVKIEKWVSGVITTVASTDRTPPGAGATLTLECGTATGPEYCRVLINGVPVSFGGVTEVNVGGSIGASYRGWGMCAWAEGYFSWAGPAQAGPGNVNSWSGQDN